MGAIVLLVSSSVAGGVAAGGESTYRLCTALFSARAGVWRVGPVAALVCWSSLTVSVEGLFKQVRQAQEWHSRPAAPSEDEKKSLAILFLLKIC